MVKLSGETVDYDNERMRIGMFDELSTSALPSVPLVQNDKRDIVGNTVTVNLFGDKEEDIETLKSHIKSSSCLLHDHVEDNFENGINCNSRLKNLPHEKTMPEAIKLNEKVGLTDDNVIDRLNRNVMKLSLDQKEMTVTGNSCERVHPAQSGNLVNKSDLRQTYDQDNSLDEKPLTVSSLTLTQDVSVNVKLDNNRLSSVLENIGLPLLYIPTTRQLVAGRLPDVEKQQPRDSPTSNASSGISTEREENNRLQFSESENASLSHFTPGYHSNLVFDLDMDSDTGIQNASEISGLDETDLLMKVTDYDRLTCNSFEFETGVTRTNTSDSLMRTFTDASSLSSISTSTDFSVSAVSIGDDRVEGTGLCIDTGDIGFMEINLHSRNSFERTKNPSQDSGIEDRAIKSKRKGLTNFFSRNLFSRKSKEDDTSLGWKLFGRIPPKSTPPKQANQICAEYKAKQQADLLVASRAKKHEIEVLSTTALILENRPMNLPSKDPEEAERHRQEYEAMVEAARKKEQKESRQKKRQKQQQLRHEDILVNASRIWTKDILPNWDMLHNGKKARELWWSGIPPSVRGKVWKLAIGNDLNITKELYEICMNRAEDRIKLIHESELLGISGTPSEPSSSKEGSIELIKLDVSRTFPQLCIFQMCGPYHDLLYNLLGAYTCYRPDVGYVQGMSFIAAVLLLNMDVADAFICFSNLLNRPCQVAFFRLDEGLIKSYFDAYEEFFQENMSTLYTHFKKNSMTPDLYLIDWMFSLFSKSLPLDVACRVWDVFCRDGEEFLLRTSLGILKMYEDILPNMDFIHLAQFLTRLPEDVSADRLFRCIDQIKMTIDKKKFAQILASNKESQDAT